MTELLRSNNPVLISYVEALLKGSGIQHATYDTHMSVMEGSLGILPRRLLVGEDDIAAARRLLRDAGLEGELSPGPRA